mmetsp:Transcript_754/g.1095  ORF Transcript_754/g.1095 Transcript_754/m.1095 type:complete len:358 (-) Transcript_754:129-1202(-)
MASLKQNLRFDLIILISFFSPFLAHASLGDVTTQYRSCVSSCELEGCSLKQFSLQPNTHIQVCSALCFNNAADEVPRDLRLTLWTCQEDCRYLCMRHEEGPHGTSRTHPLKYFGKWPFLRVLGCQEIASTLLSLVNFAAHLAGFRCLHKLSRTIPAGRSRGRCYYRWLQVHCVMNLNAWVWSAVFHTRDVRLTEVLDYFSADAVIFNGLVLCLVRMFGCSTFWTCTLCAAPVLLVLGGHYYYMLYVKFDYGWNVIVCVAAGALQAFSWLMWSHWQRHPLRWHFLRFSVLIHLALLLELLDFPPFQGLLDAHALWHAATPPLIYFWYSIHIFDLTYLVKSCLTAGDSVQNNFRTSKLE